MTAPSNDMQDLVAAINSLDQGNRENARYIEDLEDSIRNDSAVRNQQAKTLTLLTTLVVIGVTFVIIIGIATGIIAYQSAKTSENNGRIIQDVRLTQITISYCQRLNPVTQDPEGVALIDCIQSVYPDLTLPQELVE